MDSVCPRGVAYPFIALLVALLAWLSHEVITDRNSVMKLTYPLEALAAKRGARCSGMAPKWMRHLLDYTIDTHDSLSNQIAYIEPSGDVHHCESGWISTMFRSPHVEVETRFRLASLTKLVTADAVLDQIRAGRLTLDTRLLDLLPELRPVADPRIEEITVEHLLRHKAGFDRMRRPDPMTMHRRKPWCPERISDLALVRLDFNPGTRFAYSNLGYCLLGVVVERLAGESYRGYVEDRYQLRKRGFQFVDGPYLADEVEYDFRNSNFYSRDYYRYFDFSALSSAAGLSGNAVSFALLVREMASKMLPNILSANTEIKGCDVSHLKSCFGYAFSVYRKTDGAMTVHVQSGFLFGSSSQAVVDSNGGVTVWLGSGMVPRSDNNSAGFVEFLYDELVQFYK